MRSHADEPTSDQRLDPISVSGFSCEERNNMADGAQLTAAAATGDEKVLYL